MYGAAFARVEVDLLSGENKVSQAHLSFDLGDPTNLGIELGQIEGGFIMGLGHYKFENMDWDENGKLIQTGAKYTAPYSDDLPENWHISLNK